jgi:hypothetical protein
VNGTTVPQSAWLAMLRSIAIEGRYAFREVLPSPWSRALVLVTVFVIEAALCLALALHPPRDATALGSSAVTGLLGLNLVVGTAAASSALARLLASSERLSLFQLAPISERVAVAHLLAPPVFAAMCPVLLLGFPFAIAAVARVPWFGLGFFAASVSVFSWAVIAAIAVTCWSARRFGRERGAVILRGASLFVGLGAMFAFRSSFRLDAGPIPLAVLVATLVVIPPLAVRASRALLVVLSGVQSVAEAKEPAWGSAGWGRTIARTVLVPVLITAIPTVVLLVFQPRLRPLFASLCIVQLAALPLYRLLEPEMEQPDRLRLAPEGATYRRRLIACWGGISSLLAVLVATAVAFDEGRWRWLGGVGTAAVLVPITYFIDSKTMRTAGQLVLAFAAVICSALWSQ